MTAARAIDAALLNMAARDQRTPCQGRYSELWTAEDHIDRGLAATLCTGCPLLACCAQYGDEIKASAAVYGGTDRTPTNRKGTAA